MAVVVVNLEDLRQIARSKMDPIDYDYFASGAEDEITLHRNVRGWRSLTLWPRFLANVSNLSLCSTLLGLPISMPLMVPPMAMQKLAHSDGEAALARAAAQVGVPYCITQQATMTMEAIRKGAPDAHLLFQMYMFRDRRLSEALIRRAEAVGVVALVVTVDAPVLGRRERDLRNKFTPASRGIELPNWKPGTAAPAAGPVKAAVTSRIGSRDAAFQWSDLDWLRSVTRLPLILKGIVHPGDAVRAVECGCSAVWVSNHGGRQLDGGPSTASALPLVASALEGRHVPVIVDGGIRRGVDVLKALAMGATVACVGRPLLWGLAADGEQGASLALTLIREELSTAMALTGVADVKKAREVFIQAPGESPPDPRGPRL